MSAALKEQLIRDIAAHEPLQIATAVSTLNRFGIGTNEVLKLQNIAANVNRTKAEVLQEELLLLTEATLELLHDALRKFD